MNITAMQITQILPDSVWRVSKFIGPINTTLDTYGISTSARIAAFIAQVGVESGQLRYVRELWGPTPQQKRYDPPGGLADELGNTQAGDGFKYRGRGLIQITGRSNYEAASASLGQTFYENPELVEEPLWAAMVSGWFWEQKGLNALADKNDSAAFEEITKRVNGGLTAEAQRLQFWLTASRILAC